MLGYEGILSRLNSLPKEQQDSLLDQTSESVGQCFIPSPGPQTAAFYSPASLLLYGGGAGGGKLIRLNEKLVTPTGFTLMGDIKVGDTVIDKDGLPCNVTAVSDINPSPELWKFTFDDKTEVVSCIDHQWLTYSAKELGDLLKRDTSWKANRRANRPSRAKEIKTKSEKFYAALLKRNQTIKPEPLPLPTGSVHTTREIINSLTVHAKKRSNHAIPLCVAPDFPEQELLVPPYTLGAWLGDGTSASGGFTGIDPEIWERIEEDGYEVSHGKGLDAEKRHHILGLSPQLREIGVLNNKHIPIQYLRGSRTQRITLLQGLMDTDGTVARCSGSAEFCNTNEAIIDGVYELICSLGWKVNKREGRAKLYGRDCGAKWTLKFLPDDYVFYLPRKRKIQGIAKRQSQKFRYIESAIKVESEAGRCITVDSPSSTYLISSSFLPTHNSKLIIGLALTAHRASLIMRRKKADSTSLQEDTLKTYGSRDGYNGSNTPSLRTKDGRFIEFGGCENIGDEQSYQGRAHGLKAFDEVTQFNENQVKYIMGWNRTADPLEVRCRTVFASNPPISTQGDWIIGMFRPWLDVTHENPAKDGELRWFITDNRDNEIEVPDSNPIEDGYDITGKKQYIIPKSRTFIRSLYTDNPYLASDYKSTLDSLPSVFRAAMRDGDFMMARKDTEGQIIPTAWIRAAQERWTDKLPTGVPMCAIGVDPAAGGCFDDITEILTNDGWKLFSQLSGKELVLTLNGENAEWGAITKIHAYNFDGELNIYDGTRVNFAITDNHNLLVRATPKALTYTIKRYDELPVAFVIRRTNEWVGEYIESVKLICSNPQPNGGVRVKEWTFSILDWADFLGWFVSEGWVGSYVRHKNKEIIGIAQKTPHKMKMIADLLERMGLKFKFEKDKTEIKIYNQSLAEHLEMECGIGASNKRVPRYIRESEPKVMTKFLESFRLGDGTKGSLGQTTYVTSSKLLADDLQEMLCKLGRAGKISRRECAGTTFIIEGRKATRRYDTYAIYERSNISCSKKLKNRDSEILKSKVKKVPYNGTVYCVSTPLRTIMVRRKGCAMWSGNSDSTVLAPRYDGYYPKFIKVKGADTPFPQDVAGLVIRFRRDAALPIIDCGGGYGGGVVRHLQDNGIVCRAFNGVNTSMAKTADRMHGFANKRTEAYFKFAEALDPSQPGGSTIALPPSVTLLSDLASGTYKVKTNGDWQMEAKADIKKRIGRSPDEGDACVMAWTAGASVETRGDERWDSRKKPKAVMGYANRRR